ncbi:MAG: hypothetical protein KME17_30235 [Cyanosarcina radialis HA8281-LM2]|nr:hypothetical protein [Cyanosarcina radialis HA8281-LM2]
MKIEFILESAQADFVCQGCGFNRQGKAVDLCKSHQGTIENCDLRGNDRGAFKIGFGCSVQRRENTTWVFSLPKLLN